MWRKPYECVNRHTQWDIFLKPASSPRPCSRYVKYDQTTGWNSVHFYHVKCGEQTSHITRITARVYVMRVNLPRAHADCWLRLIRARCHSGCKRDKLLHDQLKIEITFTGHFWEETDTKRMCGNNSRPECIDHALLHDEWVSREILHILGMLQHFWVRISAFSCYSNNPNVANRTPLLSVVNDNFPRSPKGFGVLSSTERSGGGSIRLPGKQNPQDPLTFMGGQRVIT